MEHFEPKRVRFIPPFAYNFVLFDNIVCYCT